MKKKNQDRVTVNVSAGSSNMVSFRNILHERELNGEYRYHTILEEMKEAALKTWQSQLGEDQWGSYTGFPHAFNIEKHLDNLVSPELKQELSSVEIFILLGSVLLHDIGKIFVIKNKDIHEVLSCLKIQEIWANLRIPDKELAYWIAIISCSHGWDTPVAPKKCKCITDDREKCRVYCTASRRPSGRDSQISKLDAVPYREGKPVRLKWLAVLLKLCDEVDNQTSRSVPEYIRRDSSGTHMPSSPSWRRLINDIRFDHRGECIKLRTASMEPDSGWDDNDYELAQRALDQIDKVLLRWRAPLQEMGLFFVKSFIEVMVPAPALFSAENVLSFISEKKIVCSIEPILKKRPIFGSLIEAMHRLDHAVIGFEPEQLFPWDVLTEETGINNIELIKLAAERVSAMHQCMKFDYVCESAKGILFPNVLCSYNGWIVRHKGPTLTWRSINGEAEKSPVINAASDNIKEETKEDKEEAISTGILALDQLLFPESIAWNLLCGGMYLPNSKGKKLPPVVTIHGNTGQGKTTLCLQVALNLVMRKPTEPCKWTCIYYALEQEPANITQHLEGYEYFYDGLNFKELTVENRKKLIVNMVESPWYNAGDIFGKVLFPRLTPCPMGKAGISTEDLFERRYRELECSIEWAKSLGLRPFYFIDSISAYINEPLSRGQVQRIFTLFRSNEIPIMVTLETHQHWALQQEELNFDYIRYLSDIVIELSSAEINGYFRQTIEVQKTRYNRRILGKHLLKLKSPKQKATQGFDDRIGVVVYPSIDNHLVSSRYVAKRPDSLIKDISLKIPHDKLPIGLHEATNTGFYQRIATNSCIVISGPMGGHKFALAMNLLIAASVDIEKEHPARNLIVSLAEEKEIRLSKVALLENLQEYRNRLCLETSDTADHKGKKIFEQKGEHIALLNYRLGRIMPEEFLYLFESYLDANRGEFGRLLFADTSQLRTRCPLLSIDPLFLPTLVDIIKSRGLMSVFIDVTDRGVRTQSLLAAADCRILMERDKSISGNDIWENLLRVDNVRGKDYDRGLRVLSVDRDTNTLTLNDRAHVIAKRYVKDRRHSPRVTTRGSVSVMTSSGDIIGEGINMSKEGICVCHRNVQLLFIESPLDLKSNTTQKVCRIKGSPKWSKHIGGDYHTGLIVEIIKGEFPADILLLEPESTVV